MNLIKNTATSKISLAKLLPSAVLLVFFSVIVIGMMSFRSVQPRNHKQLAVDSLHTDTALSQIEVLTSQQLFTISSRPASPKSKKRKFSAELRDAFKLVHYLNDSTSRESNWQMASKYGIATAGVFTAGSPEFQKLDSLLSQLLKSKEGDKGSK
ncbi:hypothetical protein [Pedobacter rhizosphaerae]|uniref:Uncharacterized protein n=1 Tax=Pedobacter rhizosphaerae TaxID=390241 RepID=A0A1H9SGV2_9SPHI|nr:hypothetical protein [Pedobacter rhizosphaerae]SER84266.1 hypothetical protein SAMN04488023_11817 [Pedobacter rhizosphaerae]